MPRRCVVGGCGITAGRDNIPLHKWPTDSSLATKWKSFVLDTRKDVFTPSEYSHICCLHFEEEMFASFQSWKMGYGKLQLLPHAVPTIKKAEHNPLSIPTTPSQSKYMHNINISLSLLPVSHYK